MVAFYYSEIEIFASELSVSASIIDTEIAVLQMTAIALRCSMLENGYHISHEMDWEKEKDVMVKSNNSKD